VRLGRFLPGRLPTGSRRGPAHRDCGLLVVDALGQPVRPEWYSDRFRALSRTAGVPPITLHSVRHPLAFWLDGLGVTPADAAALLGRSRYVS
jgi:hypothetical protein